MVVCFNHFSDPGTLVNCSYAVIAPVLRLHEQQIMSTAADLAVLWSTRNNSGFTKECMKETWRDTWSVRPRIKTEEKTKVVSSVFFRGGENLINSLPR